MTTYKAISSVLRPVGRSTLDLFQVIGKIFLFVVETLSHFLRPPYYWKELTSSIFNIGYLSLPVVGLTALFTGGALALQIYSGGARFNAESVVPSIVAIGMVRELGPVLGGLMVAGRVASSIAAELGTMKVTEQIDALKTLSTHPIKYLTIPRVLATTISLPILVAIGDIIGILGGYLVAINRLDFNGSVYLTNTINFLEIGDITSGLIKASVFGFIVAIMGCYHGQNSNGGAQGVGKATINAVVSSSVLILTANYLLTELFF